MSSDELKKDLERERLRCNKCVDDYNQLLDSSDAQLRIHKKTEQALISVAKLLANAILERDTARALLIGSPPPGLSTRCGIDPYSRDIGSQLIHWILQESRAPTVRDLQDVIEVLSREAEKEKPEV